MHSFPFFKKNIIVSFYFLLFLWFLVGIPFLENLNSKLYYSYFASQLLLGTLTLILLITKKINKNLIYLLFFAFIFILKDILAQDSSGVIDQINFFFGILITYTIAKFLPIHRGNIKIIMMLNIFFLFVFLIFIKPESISFSFDSSRLFVKEVHRFAVNFIFILLAYLYAFNIRSFPSNLKHIIVLSLLALLVISTGSRTIIYAMIFIFSSLFLEKFKPCQNNIFRFFTTSVFVILTYVVVFYLESFFSILESGYLYNLLGVEHIENNFSSGREWLWTYHFELFYNNMVFGVNSETLDWELGDTLSNGSIAHGGGETLYSKFLAADGLLGILKIYIYIYIVWFSLKRGNYFAYLVASFLLIANSSLSILGNSYSLDYALYSLFFWSIFFYSDDDFKYKKKYMMNVKQIP